jgi:hypothetical protein
MSPKKPGIPRWLIGVVAAFGTIAILVYAGYATSHKKDNRPSGPLSCAALATKSKLAKLTDVTSLNLNKLGANSTDFANSQFCDYTDAASGRIMAQTVSQQALTARSTAIYKATLRGQDDSLTTSKVPASQLPEGVDDGYYFTPTNLSTGHSIFLNSGVTMRSGTQIITVSFRDFSKQLDAVKWDFMYAAAQQLNVNQN